MKRNLKLKNADKNLMSEMGNNVINEMQKVKKELESLFIPFQLAKKLKKKGFDMPCLAFWEDNKFAPKHKMFPAQLIINYTNVIPTDPMFKKRPGMFKITNKNSDLPQWAVSAPTEKQVVDWFEKEHDIHISKTHYDDKIYPPKWTYHIDKYYVPKGTFNDAVAKAIKIINNPKMKKLFKMS